MYFAKMSSSEYTASSISKPLRSIIGSRSQLNVEFSSRTSGRLGYRNPLADRRLHCAPRNLVAVWGWVIGSGEVQEVVGRRR